jgi:hypothetical protein
MQANLAQAVQVIETAPHFWPFDITPADLGARVLAMFPASVELVALATRPQTKSQALERLRDVLMIVT